LKIAIHRWYDYCEKACCSFGCNRLLYYANFLAAYSSRIWPLLRLVAKGMLWTSQRRSKASIVAVSYRDGEEG